MQIQHKYKSRLSVWEVLSWSRNKNISDKYGSREYPAHGETTVISIALAPQRISWTFHSTPPTRVSAIKRFSSVSQKCWYRQLKSHVWITFINQSSFLNSQLKSVHFRWILQWYSDMQSWCFYRSNFLSCWVAFFPKCCVLWCFYESDVLGCWLFPFTDGGNIYSNWEPTYQLVDSWEKHQQQGAIWRPRQASGKKAK